jgi:transglutaminase-like putative cysteine protease
MAFDPVDIPLFQVLKQTVDLNKVVARDRDVRIDEFRNRIRTSEKAPFDMASWPRDWVPDPFRFG